MEKQGEMKKEQREKKEDNNPKKTNFDFKRNLPFIVILFLIALVIVVYFMFFRLTPDVRETALDLRNTTLDLSLGEGHNLNDYSSLYFANNALVYNTCTGEKEVYNNDMSWARNWWYLILFDSMYSELVNVEDYDTREGKIVLDSLYDQFSFESEKGEEVLEVFEMFGLESLCLPYFILDGLERTSLHPQFEKTHSLSQKLCYDSYDEDNVKYYCEDESSCMDDDLFYSELESLFLVEEEFVADDESYLENYYTERFIIPQEMTDHYIVAYDLDWEPLIDFTNGRLFDGIDYFVYSMNYMNNLGVECPCVLNHHFYLDLLKAMSIKGDYLKSSELLERHRALEYNLLQLCATHQEDLSDWFNEERSLGHKIEFYYIFRDNLERSQLDGVVKDYLTRELVSKEYNGKSYSFFNNSETVMIDDSDDCAYEEIDFTKNLKTSLYMLIYSAYED